MVNVMKHILWVALLPVKIGSLVPPGMNFKGHTCGRSLNTVVRFIGVKGNHTPSGLQRANRLSQQLLRGPWWPSVYCLGFQREQRAFKWPNLLPGHFPSLCWNLVLSNPFLDLAGFYALIQAGPFSRQAPPLYVPILAPTAYASSRRTAPPWYLGSHYRSAQQRNPPFAPRESQYWFCCSFRSGIKFPGLRVQLSPREAVNIIASY